MCYIGIAGSSVSNIFRLAKQAQGNCSYNTELGGETYFMKKGTSTVLVKRTTVLSVYLLALVTGCNTVT